MAIRYLDNLNLEENQLLNASLQQLAADPTGFEGQIIYNTTSKTLKYFNGTAFVSLDGTGDITGVTAGTGLSGGGTSGAITVSVDYAGVDNIILSAAAAPAVVATDTIIISDETDNTVKKTAISTLPFTDNTGTVTSVGAANGTFISSSSADITTSGDLTYDLSATGTASATTFLRGDNTWATVSTGTMSSFDVAGDSGTAQTITDGNTINFLGGEGIVTDAAATDDLNIVLDLTELPARTATIDPKSDKLIGLFDKGADQNTVIIADLGLSMFAAPSANLSIASNKLTDVTDPTAAQDAATKNYVDSTFAGSGALIFQGSYDASVAPPSAGVLQGWTYAVTVAGDGGGFFSPTLEVGDLIIANIDTPTTAADWTEVNKNIDVATATVQGIANFPTAGGLSISSGAVSMPNVVTAGTVGSATQVGQFTVDAKGRITARSNVSIQITAAQVTNFCAEVRNCEKTTTEFVATIGDGVATRINVKHGLNTQDVIVQVYDAGTFDTIMTNVTRVDVLSVDIETSKPLGVNQGRVLIKAVGV